MSHIFVSYVQEDESIAVEIAHGLESAAYRTWYYKRDCVPGASYLLQTGQAIEESQAVVLVISPNSLGSHQITKEVVRAHEAGKPFVPVLTGIQFPEFQQRQPEWREALGAATSIEIPPGGVAEILPRIVDGLKSLGQRPGNRAEPQPQAEQPRSILDARTSQVRSYIRVIFSVGVILLLSPFVGGTVLLLSQRLASSNPRSLAYVFTAICDAVAFYFLFKSEKKRSAAEQARRRLEVWAQTSRSAAFRSLDPYSEADTLPGTERKRQARRLVTSIKDPSFRFGVVSGDVGCGKTSLLQSEVQRLLKSEHLVPILLTRPDFSETKDIAALCDRIRTAATKDRASRSRVLIVDQIEEIFTRFPGREARDSLGAVLGQLIHGDQQCRVVCAIRKDYFLDLYDIGAKMGVDVRPTLMLHNFTPDEAKEVIRECASDEGLTFTEALVETVVSDLTKEGQVRPPELQIVCTALTANFTIQHYNEVGGAKGILESYLALTLETCIDQQIARLILRQFCDFERQAKAEPKTTNELARAIGPAEQDLEATTRTVQLVLDHLVRSRLATAVHERFALIHDYWVSVIHDLTAHDKTKREKADELLRRHLYERESGFATTLNSKQLRLVRQFASPDLLGTRDAENLLRRSVLRLWMSRGLVAAAVVAIIIGGLLSSEVVWQPVALAEGIVSTGGFVRSRFNKDAKVLILTTSNREFNVEEEGPISIWNISNGRVSQFAADDLWFSPDDKQLLYTDHGQSYLVDLVQGDRRMFPLLVSKGDGITFSRSGTCVLHDVPAPNADESEREFPGLHLPPDSTRFQVWKMPDGIVRGTIALQETARPDFVSDNCDRAIFTSVKSVSKVSLERSEFSEEHRRVWFWLAPGEQLRSIVGDPKIKNVRVATSEKLHLLFTLEEDLGGSRSITRRNWTSGYQELSRQVELGKPFMNLEFSRDGERIILTLSKISFARGSPDWEERFRILRTTDLQLDPSFPDSQKYVPCSTDHDDTESPRVFYLWSTAKDTSFVWDGNAAAPASLPGLDTSDIETCRASADQSDFVVLRKNESAELWSFKGKKVADLRAGGPVKFAGFTLQSTAVRLLRESGEIVLLDRNGSVLETLPSLGATSSNRGSVPEASFDPACGYVLVWTPKGRVLKYTKKLKIFGAPYLLPVFWHSAGRTCGN
jgi:hypothetical protein